MAAKYDKYDPIAGGFRAPLAADLTFDASGHFGPKGVTINASGQAVVGNGGTTTFVGVLVKNVPSYPAMGNIPGAINAGVPIGGKATNVVDIMTQGEITGVPGLTAGTVYYFAADGSLTATAPAAGVNAVIAGHTVESDRLVVRIRNFQG